MKLSERAHPRICVHGKTISEGECCRKSREIYGQETSSLVNLESKQRSKVVYIQTKDHKKLQKLMAMGILPGMNLILIQKYPSYVLQVGQSQFAIDQELAEIIFIRKTH